MHWSQLWRKSYESNNGFAHSISVFRIVLRSSNIAFISLCKEDLLASEIDSNRFGNAKFLT